MGGIKAVFTGFNLWIWGENTVWPESPQPQSVLGIHSIANLWWDTGV